MTLDAACRLVVETIDTLRAERILRAETEAQRDQYREIVQVALAELHALTGKLRRQSETIGRLSQMLRAQRRRQEHAA